jgi:hypothetical protein
VDRKRATSRAGRSASGRRCVTLGSVSNLFPASSPGPLVPKAKKERQGPEDQILADLWLAAADSRASVSPEASRDASPCRTSPLEFSLML